VVVSLEIRRKAGLEVLNLIMCELCAITNAWNSLVTGLKYESGDQREGMAASCPYTGSLRSRDNPYTYTGLSQFPSYKNYFVSKV
jgi:hypothetical protein